MQRLSLLAGSMGLHWRVRRVGLFFFAKKSGGLGIFKNVADGWAGGVGVSFFFFFFAPFFFTFFFSHTIFWYFFFFTYVIKSLFRIYPTKKKPYFSFINPSPPAPPLPLIPFWRWPLPNKKIYS
ncbi:hypothetical protein AWJ00_15330 [Listeria monocytogenes]|nr:hypothetical protein AWJ00_15330 [Listeria monocytogenes]